jgi:hypothetical protein
MLVDHGMTPSQRAYDPRKSAMTAFASGAPVISRQIRLPTAPDDNPGCQERAALALQIDDARD